MHIDGTCICIHFLKEYRQYRPKVLRIKILRILPKTTTKVAKTSLRACLHGGGGPQIGEVTCGGSPHLSCKRDQIKMRDYMDRWVTPPKRVTSPTCGPPPPCKQALKNSNHAVLKFIALIPCRLQL